MPKGTVRVRSGCMELWTLPLSEKGGLEDYCQPIYGAQGENDASMTLVLQSLAHQDKYSATPTLQHCGGPGKWITQGATRLAHLIASATECPNGGCGGLQCLEIVYVCPYNREIVAEDVWRVDMADVAFASSFLLANDHDTANMGLSSPQYSMKKRQEMQLQVWQTLPLQGIETPRKMMATRSFGGEACLVDTFTSSSTRCIDDLNATVLAILGQRPTAGASHFGVQTPPAAVEGQREGRGSWQGSICGAVRSSEGRVSVQHLA
ncbi:predicted protein [Plenodomus lingam JN3]|uniref:Predicted protein n=1 Tax=Leptosphaeria maculans (strain JN3 / isolate v23.1.3 / race Av1-4-5-6-7-8) TaxID=985895 RepID=E4ZJN8_LEPMJ|nr:predicted protein [Plenodomus lingam JN3]CBX91323.1 predicted protein [Plenodomus lingam JN3]